MSKQTYAHDFGELLRSSPSQKQLGELFLCGGGVLPAMFAFSLLVVDFSVLPSLSVAASFILKSNTYIFSYFTIEILKNLSKGRC